MNAFGMLIPPIAVGLGITILGEKMGNEALLGFGLIAIGLLVTDGRLLDKLRQQPPRKKFIKLRN